MQGGAWYFAVERFVRIEADEEQMHAVKIAVHEAGGFPKIAFGLKALDPTILDDEAIDSEGRQDSDGGSQANHPPTIARDGFGQSAKGRLGSRRRLERPSPCD